MEQEKGKVLFDGDCKMCNAFSNTIGKTASGHTLRQFDIQKETFEGFKKEDLVREIHYIENDGTVHRNIDAVLKIAEETYPELKKLIKLGWLPGVHYLLRLGYKFVAHNRYVAFGETARLFWIKIILLLGTAVSILITYPLWISTREYPLLPLLHNLYIPFPADYILFTGMLFVLGIAFFKRIPRVPILSFVFLMLFLAVFDQSRWMPWIYQYVLMFIALGLFSWKEIKNEVRVTENTLRIIIFFVYFWSGVHKINIYFFTKAFEVLVSPLLERIPNMLHEPFLYFAYIVPFIEIFIAIGLLTKKLRTIALLTAFLMHLVILAILISAGLIEVIFLWNVLLLSFACILFFRTEEKLPASMLTTIKKSLYAKLVVALLVIIPFLNFFYDIDTFPSFSIYSGNKEAVKELVVSEDVYTKFPEKVKTYAHNTENGLYNVNVNMWTLREIGTFPYPEERIFKNIVSYMCTYAGDNSTVSLTIYKTPPRTTNIRPEFTFTCKDI